MLSRTGAILAGVLAAVVLATGCGVPLQDEPAALEASQPTAPPTPDPAGQLTVRVYLVEDERLAPVVRAADDLSVASAVGLLAEGPTGSEEAAGATTALVPGSFSVEEPADPRAAGASVVIDVPVQFTQIDGDLQLLATAQLVWTATESRPEDPVRMTFDGEVIELPTDRGLTSGPVRRSDFASVAPGPS